MERFDDGATVRIGGSAEGRRVEVVERSAGEPLDRIAVDVQPVDTTREPGMTDAQLKEKIERQFAARGMRAEATIEGDKITVRAEQRIERP